MTLWYIRNDRFCLYLKKGKILRNDTKDFKSK